MATAAPLDHFQSCAAVYRCKVFVAVEPRRAEAVPLRRWAAPGAASVFLTPLLFFLFFVRFFSLGKGSDSRAAKAIHAQLGRI